MTFEPIYGWGWYEGDAPVDVPPPLSVAVASATDDEVLGSIEPPHVFAGMRIRLAVRSRYEGTTDWNVFIETPSNTLVTGFAMSP